MINSTCISASNSEQWNAHRYSFVLVDFCNVGMINSTCISASNSEQWNNHKYLFYLCWLIFVMLVWLIAPVSVPVTPSNGTTTGIYVFYLCWYVGMINSTCISASNSEQWNDHRYLFYLCWLIFVMLVWSIAPVSVPVTPSNGTPTGIYFICVGWFL